MSRRRLLLLSLIGSFFSFPTQAETWKAGAARIVITPDEPVWMAGYGSRDVPAQGKRTDLFARALFLEDAKGNNGLIITLDLVGIDKHFADRVTDALGKQHDLQRDEVAICTSHTHSGPVVSKNLGPLHYFSVEKEEQEKIDAYAEVLLKKILEVSRMAFDSRVAARLQSGSGKCTFAVNRRENKPYNEVPEKRAAGLLEGPVDHDVPVLSVRRGDGTLLAILFGYACHATTLSANEWNADYPGYAQTELEKRFPGATALFWAGCGGDQNPLPRRELSLAEDYGSELAERVVDVLKAPMPVLKPSITTRFKLVDAPLQELPTGDELKKTMKSANRFEVARARYLARKMEKEGGLAKSYPFPIGVWNFGGEIDLVFLGGEVVVDYALRIKEEGNGTRTWVAAYANDVMAYIPSTRVAREGGYEGGGSNVYYGLPSMWDDSLESLITSTVRSMSKQ